MSSNFTVQTEPRQKRENALQRALQDPDSRETLKKVAMVLLAFGALLLFNFFVDSGKAKLLADAKGQNYFAIEVLQHGIMPHLMTDYDGALDEPEHAFGDPAVPLLGDPIRADVKDLTAVYRLRIKTRPDDQAPWQYVDADVVLVEDPDPQLREACFEFRGKLFTVTWKGKLWPVVDKQWFPDLLTVLLWKQ